MSVYRQAGACVGSQRGSVDVSTSCNVRGGVTGQQMMESWAESAKQP